MSKKTAIVTGAAGGLGAELSQLLVEQDWNVVMLDSNRAGLVQIYDRIGENGPGAPILHPMDLAGADPETVEELLEGARQHFGRLDAVVHGAARFESLTPSEHVSPEEWLLTVQVNLNAAWLLSTMALPLLRKSGEGRLVFVLEDLDKVSKSYWGAYGVCKHALRALVSQMEEECRSSGLQVRGAIPGPMRSAIRSKAYHSENPVDVASASHYAKQITSFIDGKSAWPDVITDLREFH